MTTEQGAAAVAAVGDEGPDTSETRPTAAKELRDRRHKVWRYPLKLWDRIHNRPFTALGILLAIVACTRPQVFHIVVDLPWSKEFPDAPLRAAGFIAAAGWLIGAAVAGMVLVVAEDEGRSEAEVNGIRNIFWRVLARLEIWMRGGWKGSKPSPGWFGRLLSASGRRMAALADLYPRWDAAVDRRSDRRNRNLLAAAFVVGALAWMGGFTALAEPGLRMAELQRRLLLGLALLASGAWFFVGPRVPGAPSLNRRTVGRYIFMVTFGLLWGELVWALPTYGFIEDLFGSPASFRFYTIWGVLFLLFLIVATGRVVDLASTKIKLLVVLGALVVSQLDAGFVVDTQAVNDPERVAAAHLQETEEWFKRLEQRIQRGQPDRPVVVVAASGGGSRAAMFAGLVYEHLAHVGFDGKPVTRPEDSIASNIAMVSSVSGGSLASAYFVAGSKEPKRDVTRNFMTGEVSRTIKSAIEKWNGIADDCQKDRSKCVSFEEEGIRRRRDDSFSRVKEDVEVLPKQGPHLAPWLFESPLVDDMATDFMAPLLRGVFTPFLERGHSVSNFWAAQFGWSKLRQHTCPEGAARSDQRWMCDWSAVRPAPLALLNATNVKTGRRVVIGYPPLPVGLLGEEMTSLSDHGAAFDLTLADGARLSANFPWGFEVGLFDPKPETFVLPLKGPRARLKLTDGGVTDNSGIDTVATLFEQLEVASRPPKTDNLTVTTSRTRAEFLARRARAIRDLILARGVMLVEVDSGARPSTSGIVGSLFPVVTDPLDALSLGGWGSATTMKRGLIARMEQAFQRMSAHENRAVPAPAQGPAGRAGAFTTLTYVCNHTDGVMTAWALGPEDKATIMASFLVEADVNARVLAEREAKRGKLDAEIQLEKAVAAKEADKAASELAAVAMANKVVDERRKAEDEQRQEEKEKTFALRADIVSGATVGPPQTATRMVIVPRRGWVYLGHWESDSQRWLTRYFEAPFKGTLPDPLGGLVAGQSLVTSGRVYVRENKPNKDGTFEPARAVLRPQAAVKLVKNPEPWVEKSGYIWAEVTY
jgi:hypothetical protein